jgi:beta-N-acetylhexosaminidase
MNRCAFAKWYKIQLLLLVLLSLVFAGCSVNNNKKTDSVKLPDLPQQNEVVKSYIKDMTLEEKIGQLMMVGIEGKELDDATADFLKKHKIGGVILFERNIETAEQVSRLTAQLQNLRSGPSVVGMFISTDQEGGRVNRLPGKEGRFPSASELAKSGQPEEARKSASKMAEQMKRMGINMNFAPIMDINSNPNNPVVGNRAFGSNPQIVSQMGLSFIKGTLDEGVIPVAKHFPGHGDTSVDSHTDMPVVKHSLDRLNNFELVPFKEAIKNYVPAIMTAHILLPALDEANPATLSSSIIDGLLRKQLGFEGVVISDDLDMGAITKLYGTGDAAVKAVKSGIDILLICHNKEGMVEAFDSLVAAAHRGEISMQKIDEAVLRVLTLKNNFGLIDKKSNVF